MESYHCVECDRVLTRCGVCGLWLHPDEVKHRENENAFCGVCGAIVRSIQPAAVSEAVQ